MPLINRPFKQLRRVAGTFTGLYLGLLSSGLRAADDAPPATPPVVTAPAGPPTSWVDPDTGHRVIRLTREPGSDSFYFNGLLGLRHLSALTEASQNNHGDELWKTN